MAAKPQRAVTMKAGSDAPPADAPAATSLRARLAAWWEGTPLPREAPAPEDHDDRTVTRRPSAQSAPSGPAARAAEPWVPERIAAATLLWGEEFVTPVGADAILELAAPLALQSGESLLDAGCALGGAARTLAAHYQLRVAAMEPSAGLAAAGRALSQRLGTQKEAPVTAYDLRTGEFKIGAFDAALAHELLFSVEDKEGLLRRIFRALKPGGRLLIDDYVIPGKTRGATIAAWAAIDPTRVRPWSLDDARKCLAKLNINVTAATDETARLRALIVDGLDSFMKAAAAHPLTPAEARPLQQEIAIWAARKEALEKGEARFMSLLGVKAGELR